jgi:hypothetical protein
MLLLADAASMAGPETSSSVAEAPLAARPMCSTSDKAGLLFLSAAANASPERGELRSRVIIIY